MQFPENYYKQDLRKLFTALQSSANGLSVSEALKRLRQFGYNRLTRKKHSDVLTIFLGQFKSPIILILLFACALSYSLNDRTNAIIILCIIVISSLIGFLQEHRAARAIEKLLAIVQVKTTIVRDAKEIPIPTEEVVPGDIAVLNAGDLVPADCYLIETKDLFVNEANLTGESFPVEKQAGVLQGETSLAKRTNCVFMGTHVISGTAKALVISTGKQTEFGKIAGHLALRPQATEFERNIKRFGYFLMEITFILVIAIFAINVYLSRPVLDSFLFALALAVGLTPQLLPAVIVVNLTHGALKMAQQKVIVKRLASIENFGSMNILCADKTGTITEGSVDVYQACDISGKQNEAVMRYAFINASYETSFTNPIDQAIRDFGHFGLENYQKVDEIPYDFDRKLLSILVSNGKRHELITKGAVDNVLAACSYVLMPDGKKKLLSFNKAKLDVLYDDFSEQGYRVLGVAKKDMDGNARIDVSDEHAMTFLGFVAFVDPIKPDAKKMLNELGKLGIALKIVTGDNRLVASYIGRQVGLSSNLILTGDVMSRMSDEALVRKIGTSAIFAEVEPNQKERIIMALRKAGNVVGFLGDGINDTSAMAAADVSISVNSAVDVAKEAADIVLLEKNMAVLKRGVLEGRITFANTLKYIFMATSANFGNMFSMAGASLFLPFLPLLPKQILLTNVLTDLPEMTIATDSVDDAFITTPHRFNMQFIRSFMLLFGTLSSLFDFLTFAVLLLVLHVSTAQLRTGWFIESVISAAFVVFIIRTRKPLFKSIPGKYLLLSTLAITVITVVLPFTKLGSLFGFVPLPIAYIVVMIDIVACYGVVAEMSKHFFYKHVSA